MEAFHNVTKENADCAFMTISSVVDYFNLLNFPQIQILKTKQSVQAMPVCMYFRKHSCLEKPFNHEINKFSSGGLIQQWARTFKNRLLKIDKTEPKALSINQIAGVMTICYCLMATSVMVFIFELMSNCHESIKLLMDFLTFKAMATSRWKLQFFSTK